MNPVLLAVAVLAYLVGRLVLRRWVRDRWLDDRLSNRAAGILFGLVSIAPLIAIFVVLLWSVPEAAPILLVAIVPAALLFIGLPGAVMDYMSAHGTKEAMKRARRAGKPS